MDDLGVGPGLAFHALLVKADRGFASGSHPLLPALWTPTLTP